MFTGVGGFELGIQQAYNEYARQCKESESEECKQRGKWSSHQSGILLHDRDRSTPLCVGVSEIDKYANKLLKQKFPEVHNYGNATKINTDRLPDFDLLVGGFPCQAFSIAGKRKGFEDTRGTLFFEIARILQVKKPQNFVLENVKGLLSHEEGRTFKVIIETLTELGYDVQWMVLNSKFFGVPQNRERVFIIGSLRGTSRPQILPFGTTSTKFDEGNAEAKVASSLQHPGHSGGNYKGMNMVYEITGNRQGYRVYSPKGVMSTQSSSPGGITKDNSIIQENKIRRLTPLECERLQGFPDNWTEGFSDTQRYKMMGNAVTVNVVQAIITKMFYGE